MVEGADVAMEETLMLSAPTVPAPVETAPTPTVEPTSPPPPHRPKRPAKGCSLHREDLDQYLAISGYGSNVAMFNCYFVREGPNTPPLCIACRRTVMEHRSQGGPRVTAALTVPQLAPSAPPQQQIRSAAMGPPCTAVPVPAMGQQYHGGVNCAPPPYAPPPLMMATAPPQHMPMMQPVRVVVPSPSQAPPPHLLVKGDAEDVYREPVSRGAFIAVVVCGILTVVGAIAVVITLSKGGSAAIAAVPVITSLICAYCIFFFKSLTLVFHKGDGRRRNSRVEVTLRRLLGCTTTHITTVADLGFIACERMSSASASTSGRGMAAPPRRGPPVYIVWLRPAQGPSWKLFVGGREACAQQMASWQRYFSRYGVSCVGSMPPPTSEDYEEYGNRRASGGDCDLIECCCGGHDG